MEAAVGVREDARHTAGVGVLAAEERHAGEAAPVRPRAGLHHAALHVGEHGEDLGEQPRAVGARELQRRQALERRQPRRPVPRPQRLRDRAATRTVRNKTRQSRCFRRRGPRNRKPTCLM